MSSLNTFIDSKQTALIPSLWNIVVDFVGEVEIKEWQGERLIMPAGIPNVDELAFVHAHEHRDYVERLIGTILPGLSTAFHEVCAFGSVSDARKLTDMYRCIVRINPHLVYSLFITVGVIPACCNGNREMIRFLRDERASFSCVKHWNTFSASWQSSAHTLQIVRMICRVDLVECSFCSKVECWGECRASY